MYVYAYTCEHIHMYTIIHVLCTPVETWEEKKRERERERERESERAR